MTSIVVRDYVVKFYPVSRVVSFENVKLNCAT